MEAQATNTSKWKHIEYLQKDEKLYRVYRTTLHRDLPILMPINSLEEELKLDKERVKKGQTFYPSTDELATIDTWEDYSPDFYSGHHSAGDAVGAAPIEKYSRQ